jgi:hypothetical protein
MQATEHTACNPSGSDHLRRTLAAQHGFTTHHRINTTPCSLPSRKSSNVQGNVLAVTVLTFATNCHFLVKRKEDFLIPRAVVFLLSPLNSVIRFIVPAILAIPASAAIVKFEWDTIGRWLVRIWGFGAPKHPHHGFLRLLVPTHPKDEVPSSYLVVEFFSRSSSSRNAS